MYVLPKIGGITFCSDSHRVYSLLFFFSFLFSSP